MQLAMATTTETAHYHAEDYVVSESNQHVYETLMRWPDWPHPSLSIVGPASSGKTHLMAMASERHGLSIIDPETLGKSEPSQLLREHVGVILDGAESLLTVENMFHLLNAAKSLEKTLIITSELPLAKLAWHWPDVRSRVATIPTLALDPPDDVLLAVILQKGFTDRQLRVPSEVVNYLARRIDRSFSSAASVVATLDEKALQHQRPITVPLVREWLQQGA